MEIVLMFTGAVVSVLVQILKTKLQTNKMATLASVLVLSLFAGAGMWALQKYGLWESFIQIVISAGAVYAFIIRNIETSLLE